jgi:predicted transcriptional regulator
MPNASSLARQVRKQLIIPTEMDQRLTSIAEDSGTTASEIVRKAITLYIAAYEKKRQGLKLGFARPDQTLETEVIGL